jgi:hypothetical protein
MGESFYQQVHRLRDGAITVYRRADAHQQVYQARLKVPGVIRDMGARDMGVVKALRRREKISEELVGTAYLPTYKKL